MPPVSLRLEGASRAIHRLALPSPQLVAIADEPQDRGVGVTAAEQPRGVVNRLAEGRNERRTEQLSIARASSSVATTVGHGASRSSVNVRQPTRWIGETAPRGRREGIAGTFPREHGVPFVSCVSARELIRAKLAPHAVRPAR